jgi:hypothetical protein
VYLRCTRGKNNANAVSSGPWAVAADRATTPGLSGVHVACVIVPRGVGGCRARDHCSVRDLGAATAAPGRTPCVLKGRQRALFRIGGIFKGL